MFLMGFVVLNLAKFMKIQVEIYLSCLKFCWLGRVSRKPWKELLIAVGVSSVGLVYGLSRQRSRRG